MAGRSTGAPSGGFTSVEMLKRFHSTEQIPYLEDRYANNPRREPIFPGPRNRQGYRGDEFDNRRDFNIAFLGCSWVEGHGLPRGEIFSDLIRDQLTLYAGCSVNCWNLGLSGAGMDYCARMTPSVLKALKPDLVVLLVSGANRREFFGSNGQRMMGTSDNVGGARRDGLDSEYCEAMKTVARCEHENAAYLLRQLRCIETLLAAAKTPWVYTWAGWWLAHKPMTILDEADMLPKDSLLQNPFAVLDTASETNLHPGRWSNQVFADRILDWIFEHRLIPKKAGAFPGLEQWVYLKHKFRLLRRSMPDERKRRAAPQIKDVMDETYPLW